MDEFNPLEYRSPKIQRVIDVRGRVQVPHNILGAIFKKENIDSRDFLIEFIDVGEDVAHIKISVNDGTPKAIRMDSCFRILIPQNYMETNGIMPSKTKAHFFIPKYIEQNGSGDIRIIFEANRCFTCKNSEREDNPLYRFKEIEICYDCIQDIKDTFK